MAGVIEWGLEAWVPEAWRGIDQPPVFLEAFRTGDEVLTLSGDFVTTPGVFGTGPTAASAFILRLVDALCEQGGGASVDIDLESRAGLRTAELSALIDSSESEQLGAGRWSVPLLCGAQLREGLGLLFGSNLDYQFDFDGLRLVERDASLVLLAGRPEAVQLGLRAVEATAADAGTELKPLGWDL